MSTRPRNGLDEGLPGDITDVSVEGHFVVMEANEWDASLASHRTVTLFLRPLEARILGEQLCLRADEVVHDKKTLS
jgi:hypothetical protein